MNFQIVWPDKRTVTAEQIATWYGDADANGEIEDQIVYDHAHLGRAPTPHEMALALHSAGLITLRKG